MLFFIAPRRQNSLPKEIRLGESVTHFQLLITTQERKVADFNAFIFVVFKFSYFLSLWCYSVYYPYIYIFK